MILHITLNSVLLPVKRRTSPGGHHYNVCLLCSLSLLTAFLPITAKQKWKTCWLWVMTVLYLMVRMGTVQLSDNFRPMHWELTISVQFIAKFFKTYPVPTHTDPSRVWVMQYSPTICHSCSPLGTIVIPQKMSLIHGVPSLPQSITKILARSCTWVNHL